MCFCRFLCPGQDYFPWCYIYFVLSTLLPMGGVPATTQDNFSGSPSGTEQLSGSITNFGSSFSAGINISTSFTASDSLPASPDFCRIDSTRRLYVELLERSASRSESDWTEDERECLREIRASSSDVRA